MEFKLWKFSPNDFYKVWLELRAILERVMIQI